MSCGLKLLDTVLALDEAVVFRFDEQGALAQAARLRSQAQGASANAAVSGERHSAWREGVGLCERAVAVARADGRGDFGRRAFERGRAARSRGQRRRRTAPATARRGSTRRTRRSCRTCARSSRATYSGRTRAFSTFQNARESFFSSRAARQRLEAFGVVSGLLTEQGFAGLVLSEATDAHAVAYLDGTLAFVNRSMLKVARVGAAGWRSLDIFGLLERFRTGVFDEPQIAVRRVLQTGQAYERELTFIDQSRTLALRIALVSAASFEGDEDARPLCVAVTVRDVTREKEYDKLKSDMLSLMSHELRTPITSINGFAELLAMDERMPEDAREYLTIINSEAQRIARMLSTFLSVAKLNRKTGRRSR